MPEIKKVKVIPVKIKEIRVIPKEEKDSKKENLSNLEKEIQVQQMEIPLTEEEITPSLKPTIREEEIPQAQRPGLREETTTSAREFYTGLRPSASQQEDNRNYQTTAQTTPTTTLQPRTLQPVTMQETGFGRDDNTIRNNVPREHQQPRSRYDNTQKTVGNEKRRRRDDE